MIGRKLQLISVSMDAVGSTGYQFDPEIDWQAKALCSQTDPEAFFPEKGGSTREAKRVCMGCEVRDDCLDYALKHNERFGIWGGLSERERRQLIKSTKAPRVVDPADAPPPVLDPATDQPPATPSHKQAS